MRSFHCMARLHTLSDMMASHHSITRLCRHWIYQQRVVPGVRGYSDRSPFNGCYQHVLDRSAQRPGMFRTAITDHCSSTKTAEPEDLEDRRQLHLRILYGQLTTSEGGKHDGA